MRTLFLATALLAQSAAHAQTPPGAAEARARLVAADTNKDGMARMQARRAAAE